MYYAACKVEFQPFNRSYSQLTFFNLYTRVVWQEVALGMPSLKQTGHEKQLTTYLNQANSKDKT